MFGRVGPSFWELARQALSSTERGYDLLAPKFDVTPFRTPDAVLESARAYVDGSLKPASMLDLCCGTGAVLQSMACQRAVGLDRSRGMLAVARINQPRARYVRADALAPPFRDAFDVVTCFSAFGHIVPADQGRFAGAVKRLLRPGGHFVFATSTMPRVSSARYWLSRGFNAAMHVRNFVWSPPFIMYYLTFLLEDARALLEQEGFELHVVDEILDGVVLVDAVREGA